jgi:hypothetical protein
MVSLSWPRRRHGGRTTAGVGGGVGRGVVGKRISHALKHSYMALPCGDCGSRSTNRQVDFCYFMSISTPHTGPVYWEKRGRVRRAHQCNPVRAAHPTVLFLKSMSLRYPRNELAGHGQREAPPGATACVDAPQAEGAARGMAPACAIVRAGRPISYSFSE